MYFKQFPDIFYEFNIKGKDVLKVVKDVSLNVRFRKEILANITLFDEYDIRDDDTPEIIAAKYYGNSEYHWVVMLCNERYHWLRDFPMSTRAFEEFINAAYDEPYGTHHYETEDGIVVNSDYPEAYSISNYQHEERINESKRRIKLISPDLLAQVINEYKSII